MDLFAAAHNALATRSPLAYALALGFGVVSSIGPCAVTRYAAVAACSSTTRRPARTVGAFVAGLAVMYALFGIATSLLGTLLVYSAYIYALGAVVFVVWGVRIAASGFSARAHTHAHGGAACAVPAPNNSMLARLRRAVESRYGRIDTFTGVFVLGAASAWVVSPCCAPFLGAAVAETARIHDPLFGATVLAIFGVGHAVPLIVYGIAGAWLFDFGSRRGLSEAVAVLFGAMMVGVGVTYAVMV